MAPQPIKANRVELIMFLLLVPNGAKSLRKQKSLSKNWTCAVTPSRNCLKCYLLTLGLKSFKKKHKRDSPFQSTFFTICKEPTCWANLNCWWHLRGKVESTLSLWTKSATDATKKYESFPTATSSRSTFRQSAAMGRKRSANLIAMGSTWARRCLGTFWTIFIRAARGLK